MTEHIISCETYVRLSNILKHQPRPDPWCNSIRLDGGLAMATNREYIVAERIDCPNPSVVHITVDPVLVEQARKEMVYHSKIHIVANDMLKFASAKTSMGYQYAGNAALYLDAPREMDRWRDILPSQLPKKSNGGMLLDLAQIESLIKCSPSGKIIFQEVIDTNYPVMVRDAVDGNWAAWFYAREGGAACPPATIPGWLK